MPLFDSARKKVIAGVTAGAIVALGGGTAWAATAAAASHTASPRSTGSSGAGASGKASTPAHRRPGGLRAILARSDHGSFEVRRHNGQWVTVTYDAGTITAVSRSSITLHRPDGQSATLTIGPSTRFSGVSSASALQVNRPARVISDNGTALRVAQRKPTAASPSTTGPSSTAPSSTAPTSTAS